MGNISNIYIKIQFITLFYSTKNDSVDTLEPIVHIKDIFYNRHYNMYYTNLASFLVLDVFPISFLIYYNFRIYKAMKSSTDNIGQGMDQYNRNQQEKTLARVMIGIVVVFIVCHSLRGIIFIYILMRLQAVHNCNEAGNVTFMGPLWFYLLFSINQLLLIINSSVNMIIYCCINSKFRKHLISIILPFSSRATHTTFTLVSLRES